MLKAFIVNPAAMENSTHDRPLDHDFDLIDILGLLIKQRKLFFTLMIGLGILFAVVFIARALKDKTPVSGCSSQFITVVKEQDPISIFLTQLVKREQFIETYGSTIAALLSDSGLTVTPDRVHLIPSSSVNNIEVVCTSFSAKQLIQALDHVRSRIVTLKAFGLDSEGTLAEKLAELRTGAALLLSKGDQRTLPPAIGATRDFSPSELLGSIKSLRLTRPSSHTYDPLVEDLKRTIRFLEMRDELNQKLASWSGLDLSKDSFNKLSFNIMKNIPHFEVLTSEQFRAREPEIAAQELVRNRTPSVFGVKLFFRIIFSFIVSNFAAIFLILGIDYFRTNQARLALFFSK